MGNFKLTEHVDSLDRIDKKHRRIIYDHAISLISSFVPDDRIDELLQNTSLYIKEKYIAGFEYTNSNYFPSYQFEDKSYEFTRFTRKGEEKEKKKRNYAPVIGWIYKDNALKDVSNDSNAFKNIIQGKQKFIKGTLEDMRKNPDVNFIEKDSKESKNINVKILIIDKKATVEPWRIRYIKHKLLLDQINERKLYELSRVKNIPFKPEKFINKNILEKMAEHDIKQIHEEMDNKEKIKNYLNKIISSSNKKDIEEKIKECAYNNFSVPISKYNELEKQIQEKISEKMDLERTEGVYIIEKANRNKESINELRKEIVKLKIRQEDISIPSRLGYISQLSSVVDRRKIDKMKEGKSYKSAKLEKNTKTNIDEIIYDDKKYKKGEGLFYDVRLPNGEILNFKIPKRTKDKMKLTEKEVKLAERKLLLDEMMIKKISNTIDYNKFDIEEFKRFPKKHTNKVVGKKVEDIIKSFQKELPTGFYTEDIENVKIRLQGVLNKGKCSQEVKKFLLEKVVPLKGSRYNFSKFLEQNENRRSRNYYNKYLKDKYNTYEKYEKDYIRQQEALFDKVKKQTKKRSFFLRLKEKDKDGNPIDTRELYNEVRENGEIKISFKIPENLDEKGIREWFEQYFDIFPANKETEGLIQDSDYFMRDSLYVDDLRKERIKSLPARRIDAGFIKRIGYIVNWVSNKRTFQFIFERHELISFLFCHV